MLPDLTPDEKLVWAAAYAASYVEDFNRRADNLPGGFDAAVVKTTSEAPVAVADAAVAALRTHRRRFMESLPLTVVEGRDAS